MYEEDTQMEQEHMSNILDDYFNVILIEHVAYAIARMDTGDLTNDEGLLGVDVMSRLTLMEREYLLKRSMIRLVKSLDIRLEIAEIDEEGNATYRKT